MSWLREVEKVCKNRLLKTEFKVDDILAVGTIRVCTAEIYLQVGIPSGNPQFASKLPTPFGSLAFQQAEGPVAGPLVHPSAHRKQHEQQSDYIENIYYTEISSGRSETRWSASLLWVSLCRLRKHSKGSIPATTRGVGKKGVATMLLMKWHSKW